MRGDAHRTRLAAEVKALKDANAAELQSLSLHRPATEFFIENVFGLPQLALDLFGESPASLCPATIDRR